jgi:hydrogenase nickel incorporation protein HypB
MESATERISVQANVLNANQLSATANRDRFASQDMLVMNLMSAPGAGKTTLLEATIRALNGQFRIAVIEGDLQTDLDAQRLPDHHRHGVPSGRPHGRTRP